MARMVVAGEGMLELSRSSGGQAWSLGHGGDTLNTAIHLARFGEHVRYLTALGDDPFSDELRTGWVREGIDPELVLTVPGAAPGLYAIRTDPTGERTFSYWRGESAARRMFEAPGIAAALTRAAVADWLVFSLISLAILPEEGRERLLDLASRMRAGGASVVFDGNHRPQLWSARDEERRWRDRAIAACTIGLPTLADEQRLDAGMSAPQVAATWRAAGAREVVVKLGAQGCLANGRILPPFERLSPVDTSGAGDAFNAAYVHARAAGKSVEDAARAGNRLAGWIVMRQGAVPAENDRSIYRD